MEDLTKTQIVLLTLLVSFITSIATGIITTSLLAQAPASVTQTIDRVIERTIERAPTQSGVPVKEVTVVREEDAIANSIESSTKSVVRIKSPADGAGVSNFYALGVVIDKSGRVLSDKRDIIAGGNYTIIFSDGSTLEASVEKTSDTHNLVIFRLQASEAKLKTLASIPISKQDPKLGQTVISVNGSERTSVAVGRALSINIEAAKILTDIKAESETQGAPLLNLTGELIGLKSSNSDLTLSPSVYTTATQIKKFVTQSGV